MFSQDRDQLRQMFFQTWQKYQRKAAMEPLERLIAEIIVQHPEYHAVLNKPEHYLARDYHAGLGETNPFLHMALHISIQEQLGTQRPNGIVELYQALLDQLQDRHEVEHQMMSCLSEMIWQAQQNQTPPNESQYLACLDRLLTKY